MSDRHLDVPLDELEQAWAADLTADVGPQPGDGELLSSLVERTIGQVPPPSTPGGSSSAATSASTTAASGGSGLSTLIGVVVALGIAGGAGYALMRGDDGPPVVEAAPVAVAQDPEPEAELPPPEEPVEAAPSEPSEPAAPDAEAETDGEPEAIARPATGKPSSSPDDLFSRANAARRARDYDDAIRLYQRLQKDHRGSREAQVSRVALGRLLLDERGQPKRALRLFDAYLQQAPNGSLAEEATAGRALALGKLGQTKAEREAWEQLLRRFPSSAYASKARSRLE